MHTATRITLALLTLTPASAVAAGPAAPAGAPAPAASAPAPAAPGDTPLTLNQALAGLPPKGVLTATFELWQKGQALGSLRCELWPEKAPVTVATFVGLARGLRPFKDPRSGAWVKRPLYDGLYVHRVVPDYIVQAGDPQCQNDPACGGRPGAGEPGFLIPDELDPSQRLDQGGFLAMANRSANENGSQFFITTTAAPHLQGRQTVFGRCAEVDLVQKITAVPRGVRDAPKEPVVIKKVTIRRK